MDFKALPERSFYISHHMFKTLFKLAAHDSTAEQHKQWKERYPQVKKKRKEKENRTEMRYHLLPLVHGKVDFQELSSIGEG